MIRGERIPVLRVGEFLLVTVQVDLEDAQVMALQEDVGRKIGETGACGVLLDISGLDVVDSFIGRVLAEIGMMAKLLGAEAVIVGMRPAVALTLVEFGLTLSGVRTALDVEAGMALLNDLV